MKKYNAGTIRRLVNQATILSEKLRNKSIESFEKVVDDNKMEIIVEKIVKYSNEHNNYEYLFKLVDEFDFCYNSPNHIKIWMECILESDNINAIHRLYRYTRTHNGMSADRHDDAIISTQVYSLASSQYKYFNLQDKLLKVIDNPDFLDLALLLSFETQEILLDYKNINFEDYPEKNDIVKILLGTDKHNYGLGPSYSYYLKSPDTKFFNYIGKLLKANKIILALYLLNNYGKTINIGNAKLLADKYIEALVVLERYDILSKYYKSFEEMNVGIDFLQHITQYFIREKKIPEAELAIKKIEALEPTYQYIAQAKKELEAIALINQVMSENIDIENIDKLSGIEFEQLLIQQFQKLGYKTIETPSTGDFGADIIVDTENETRFIIQCKRFKNKVNLKAVQEVVGAIAHFNGDLGIVITSSSFLNSAIKLAESNDIELWDKNKLMKFLTGDVSFSEIATN